MVDISDVRVDKCRLVRVTRSEVMGAFHLTYIDGLERRRESRLVAHPSHGRLTHYWLHSLLGYAGFTWPLGQQSAWNKGDKTCKIENNVCSCVVMRTEQDWKQFVQLAQKTQNIRITLIQRRPNVFDVGPTLYKCYTNVLCLLVCGNEYRPLSLISIHANNNVILDHMLY